LSHPVRAVNIALTVGWDGAAGTTAPRNRVRKRSTQPAKNLAWYEPKSFNTEDTEKSGEIRLGLMSANSGSVTYVEFLRVLCVSVFSWGDRGYFKYVRTISIKSSAASSADFVFRGMWLRM
jgi:hypothetical protein